MNDDSPALQHWLDRWRDGDPRAVEELVARCRSRLRDLAGRMLGRFPGVGAWEEASDVLNGAMLRLTRALRDEAVRTKARSPRDLLRIGATQIRRELLDLARTLFGPAGPGSLLRPPGATLPMGVGGDDPADQAVLSELLARIDEQLDADDRELWGLLYYQALTHEDAAEVLGVCEKTVGRRWLRVRELVAVMLDGQLSSVV